jgi:hypothetical protein
MWKGCLHEVPGSPAIRHGQEDKYVLHGANREFGMWYPAFKYNISPVLVRLTIVCKVCLLCCNILLLFLGINQRVIENTVLPRLTGRC